MRRDHFTVAVRDVDSGIPTLDISYEGPQETLTEQLTDNDGDLFDATTIDAAYRLQDPLGADEATGVFSLTHRITGEYLLEVNVEADDMLELVETVDDIGDDGERSYRIRIGHEDDDTVVLDMDGLFVYDDDGDLLRKHSLIPSGVEL